MTCVTASARSRGTTSAAAAERPAYFLAEPFPW